MKHTPKRIIARAGSVALALCLLCSVFALPAHADVVWYDPNIFYEVHKDECIEVRLVLAIPGEKQVSLKSRPGSLTEVKLDDYYKEILENEGYYVQCACNYRGQLWGYVDYTSHGPSFSGWIPLKNAVLAYTSQDFLEEYSGSFFAYKEDAEKLVKQLESVDVVFWKWPCSGKIERSQSSWGGLSARLLPEDIQDTDNYDFSRMFKDNQERQWVYFDCYAQRGWICLDEPATTSMPTTITGSKPWSLDPEDYPPLIVSIFPTPVLVVFLVAFVVLASVLLIVFLNKQKKRSERL